MKEIGLGKALAMTYRAGRMTPGERKELAQKRLKELAAYAGQNSPYYGRLYKGLPEDWKLTDLPTVNKVDLMAHFDMWLTDRTVTEEAVNSFMEDRENIGRLMDGKYLIFTTSGSTGSPLVVLYDKTCMNISSALSVLRAYARKEDLSAFIKKRKADSQHFCRRILSGQRVREISAAPYAMEKRDDDEFGRQNADCRNCGEIEPLFAGHAGRISQRPGASGR